MADEYDVVSTRVNSAEQFSRSCSQSLSQNESDELLYGMYESIQAAVRTATRHSFDAHSGT
jgi:hypothetical protein